MKGLKKLIFLSLFFFTVTSAATGATSGGYVNYSSLEIEDGLSQISVLNILQDSKGYLWFATRNGLNRYDGRNFVVFRHNQNDAGSISDNHITALEEDNDGNLWVGTQHGLTKLSLSSWRSTVYADSAAYEMFDKSIRALALASDGRMLIATTTGLFKNDGEGKFSSAVPELKGLVIEGLTVTPDGRVLVGTTAKGMYVLDKDFAILKHFGTHDGSLPTDDVKKIYQDSKGNVWISNANDGMFLIDLQSGNYSRFTSANSALPCNNIRCFADNGRTLFIGSAEGVCAMSLSDPAHRIVYENNNISNFSVYSIIIDNAGTRWIGTYSGGVNYHNPITDRFKFHKPANEARDYLSIYGAIEYSPDNDMLYIATEGRGLLEYDIRNDRSRFYLIDSSNRQHSYNIIKSVTYHNGEIWCGTASGEIYVFNPTARNFTPYFRTNRCSIYAILHDGNGGQWIATSTDSIGMVHLKDGKIIERSFTDAKIAIPNARVLKEVDPGVLLIGTRRRGLIKYDSTRDEVYQLGDKPSLHNAYITSITKDVTGAFYWIGTFDCGLLKYDPKTDAISSVALSDKEVPEVCQVVQDRKGDLWICTSAGVTQYNPESGTTTNFTRASGIGIQEFSLHSGIALHSGEVAFSGSNGFITFNPADIRQNPYIPPLVFTGLSVNNVPVNPNDRDGILEKSLDDTPSIRLDYDQNNLTISYAALNYIHPRQNQYAFKLDGVDDEWIYVGNRQEAYYANLAPGKYTFSVKGANNDAVWSDEIRSVDIEITPPLWKTWYAYTFYVLAFLGISVLIIYYIFKKKNLEQSLAYEQLKQQQAEEFHQSKIRMFTNFSHELRTPLTLIVSPLQELLKRTDFNSTVRNKVALIYNNSQRLLLLVNQLMDLHKNQAGRMQLKIAKDDIVPFMQEVYLAFNQIAVTNGISFNYICEVESIPAWFDKSLFEKVAFNLLSNAFKHTHAGGRIGFKVERLADCGQPISDTDHSLADLPHNVPLVHISVTDTGHGIPENELKNIFSPFYQIDDDKSKNVVGTGIGLSLTQSIVGLHHGVIWAENNPTRGAAFHVVFPIDISVYADDEIDKEAEHRVVMDVIPPTSSGDEFTTGTKRHTVLLVEDNREVRDYVKECLAPYYNVIEAEDGQTAFSLTVDRYPDIVVSDIMMPVMDGLELCSMIKNDMRTGHIPVILMTARSMVMQIKEGFSSGADDYIVKPFNMDVLLYRIRNILSSREKLRNLYGKKFSPEAMGIEIVADSDKFTQKFFAIIEKNISNSELNIEFICKEIGLSRANLYRKLKAITELSPMELIRNKRLEVAAKLLLESDYSVSEISTYVGFNSHAYFTNCFKNTYGVSPSEFIANHRASQSNLVEANGVEVESEVSM